MRRRLYFLLPDVESARRAADDLLLARVEDRHMHFLARRGTELEELHETGYFIKTDLVLGGAVLGALIVFYPIEAPGRIRSRSSSRCWSARSSAPGWRAWWALRCRTLGSPGSSEKSRPERS